jgi:hypothetical protein
LRTARAIHISIIGINKPALLAPENMILGWLGAKPAPMQLRIDGDRKNSTQQEDNVREKKFFGSHLSDSFRLGLLNHF